MFECMFLNCIFTSYSFSLLAFSCRSSYMGENLVFSKNVKKNLKKLTTLRYKTIKEVVINFFKLI